MRSAITVSLVPEANGGPFVFWNGLEDAFVQSAALGFDAVEIFPSGPEALNVSEIKALQQRTGLAVAAVGTGAGWVKHKLHLTHADAEIRKQARTFIGSMIRIAAELGAPAILGSMQGRVEMGVERAQALDWLGEALLEAGNLAKQLGQVFLYEPLNRYETNLINRQADAAQFIEARNLAGVKILADLFHMNIEEVNLADTFRAIGAHTGHVHFADSTRRAIGLGHTDIQPIYEALKEIGYSGYLSAEVLPLPSSQVAAEQTIASFKALTSQSL
ncbi:MAG: sugar phosphate isomerase/epimerase family protein [Verrucomicrobiota bacterium]